MIVERVIDEEYFDDTQKITEVFDILNLTQHSSFKGAGVFKDVELSFYNYKKKPADKFYFRKLEEKVISYNLAVLLTDQRHFLNPTFKWKIKQLIQGGFFDHWISHFKNDLSIIEKKEEEDKVVLEMDHLYVGFTIWLVMLLVSSAAFIVELARVHLPNYFRGFLFQTLYRNFNELRR